MGVCDELEVLGCNGPVDMHDGCSTAAQRTTMGHGTNSIILDCDGNCLNDADGDGVCDELEVLGCDDPIAWNLQQSAQRTTDGSCTYAEPFYDCDGNCLNDADGDGGDDELEIEDATAFRCAR